MSEQKHGFTIAIVSTFLKSNLSMVFILLALVAGAIALMVTPREEEPQIIIPAADVIVRFPGHTALETERIVSTRLEKVLHQIDGVEYVYSRSKPGLSIVTVRFYVGDDRERSLVKLFKWMDQNEDKVPVGVTGWVIKPIETDDVPIVTFTLTSDRRDDYQLRRVAEEVVDRLQDVKNAGITAIAGGRPREVLVRLNAERMAGFQVTPLDVERALRGADANVSAGSFSRGDSDFRVEAGRYFANREEVASLVVGVWQNRPVYLKDVATVTDGPGEVTTYVRFTQGPAWDAREQQMREQGAEGIWVGERKAPKQGGWNAVPAVTIAVSKQKDTNNVWVARDLVSRMRDIKKNYLPEDVHVAITRNYGVTADDKVNELVEGLWVAVVVVIALLTMGLGFTESLVVAVAVPCVFGFTLIVNYLFGFSINRVTMFALTVALGLLVDDPIVDVENIHRHFQMRGRATRDIVLEAVNEVRPPLIAATIAVIISFLPLLFVTEEMHDYLKPMAVNVPVAMLMSLFVSFTVTPWLAYHVLRHRYHNRGQQPPPLKTEAETTAELRKTWAYRVFHRLLEPLLANKLRGFAFLFVIFLLFLASVAQVGLRNVEVKQLPFDNKDELTLVLDMPVGTTLERTDAAARDFEQYLRSVPEATDIEAYVGTAVPVTFNGLARHYFLRHGSNKAGIRVNLIHKTERTTASHEIALRLRSDLTKIAKRHGVKLKIVEAPPGPPVMSTVTASVYGPEDASYAELMRVAQLVKQRLRREPGIVDIDDTVDEDHTKYVFTVDKEKAALDGVTTADVAETVRLALTGPPVSTVALPHEKNPLQVRLWMPRPDRSSRADLSRIFVRGRQGNLAPITELGRWETQPEDKTIYHRNLKRVVFVTGEMVGRPPVETIIDIRADRTTEAELAAAGHPERTAKPRPLSERTMLHKGGGVPWALPDGFYVKWWDEGEMRLTINIFRDLAVGFGAALIGIYILLMNQTGSFMMPLVIMMSIPLMIIGVMPGFLLLNHIGSHTVAGQPDPFFFTAPAVIGMLALAGIVVRNSIIIVDFIHLALARGRTLLQAVVESCAVRLRPILLTSGAAMLGTWPITLDPVFAGMAWALIFGLFGSTILSLFVIPTIYYLLYANKPGHGLPPDMQPEGATGEETVA